MVRKGWQSMDVPSDGFRFSGTTSAVRVLAIDQRLSPKGPQEGVSGLGENQRVPKERHHLPDPDQSRHRIGKRLRRKSVGGDGEPVVDALKADLAKARSKKPFVEVEIDECRSSSRGRRCIRVGHEAPEGTSFSGGGSGASRETGGRANPGTTFSRQVTARADGPFVAVRARWSGEGDDGFSEDQTTQL